MKKIFCVIALVLGVYLNASAGDFYSNNLSYSILSDSTLSVTGLSDRYISVLNIPASVEYRGTTYRVTSIGSSAFANCYVLTSVTIPESVTSIGASAFSSCENLPSITIPNSVTSIGASAFAGCCDLTSITIPESVTSIGASAFYLCYDLTSVNILDLEAWCKIDFIDECSNPLYYAGNLYLNESLLSDLKVPDSITEIKKYAFYKCTGLTSVTIGNSVTNIESFAFSNCTSLTEVTLGSSVEKIGSRTFAGIERLAKICSLNPIPPTCASENIFNLVKKDKCTLYVPLGAAEDYKTTYVWWDFTNIIEKEMSGVEDTLIDGCEDESVEYYNLQGVRVVNPERGLYIKCQGGKTTKVVL